MIVRCTLRRRSAFHSNAKLRRHAHSLKDLLYSQKLIVGRVASVWGCRQHIIPVAHPRLRCIINHDDLLGPTPLTQQDPQVFHPDLLRMHLVRYVIGASNARSRWRNWYAHLIAETHLPGVDEGEGVEIRHQMVEHFRHIWPGG